MSLEIGNLTVKISVNQGKSEGGDGSSTPLTDTDVGKKPQPEKMAKDIVEQIIKIIEDKNER
ncbi:hypothetical protein IWQ47_004359 [Aquimarina sp. EL_43]|uniref:DUF5908 family protein n=1 Tax=Aquimarina TaxID=290174 RepID=UPI0004705C70|nr:MULTISPECIES: DUF5908 family protein [Aquimarina]MBG6132811.1 hypothetical protein [Aquimarina sp. EL_35]MBG6153112.1 hypothetical protein [Aquimarina sp. EL_32]MBG6171268.1 hypothetical protein [Aquimarina sp. EL_43]